MNKAVFLDRDGVINKALVKDGKPFSPHNFNDLKILPGVKKSLRALRDSNWLIIVITNQPDVARGKITKEEVEKINNFLKNNLSVDEIYTCYHDNNDFCDCRKPQAGALTAAAKNNGIDLNKSFMIGDRWSDIEAGDRAGCKTFFIDYSYKEKRPSNFTFKVKSLAEAVDIILKS
jgi:D-glycero-D-manno-heptose 1,7-bisphosphate phosphatase